MAKCKLCKTNIPEGTEYCEDCQGKGNANSNESYLDSLLNSVKNSTPAAETVYKKRSSTNENNNSPNTIITKAQKSEIPQNAEPEDDVFRVDLSDIEDFDQFNFEDDLEGLDSNIFISDEDLFGENLSHIFNETNENEEDHDPQAEIAKAVNEAIDEEHQEDQVYLKQNFQESIDRLQQEEDTSYYEDSDSMQAFMPDGQQESMEEIAPVMEHDFVEETSMDMEKESPVETSITNQEETISDTPLDTDLYNFEEEFPGIPESSVQNSGQDEMLDIPEDNNIDLDLDELLNSLDSPRAQDGVQLEGLDEDMFHTFGEEEEFEEMQRNSSEDEIEQAEAADDDFLSLLNQMSDEDPSSDDVRAINDLLNNVPEKNSKNMPSDVGEVFSDALKAVSSLKDYELDEEGILAKIPDGQGKKGKKDQKASKKDKTAKSKKEKVKKEKAKKEKPELSLFQRLFGNIKDDKTAAKHSNEVNKSSDVKEVAPKKKKGKVKKGAEIKPEEDEDVTGKNPGKGKSANKKESKKDKAEKKKKTKEIIQVIDEIDEDPGRINRLGALIVFVFFGVMVLIVVLGSEAVSYSLSIDHATTYFNDRKYTQAYNEVYGVDIKDEDIEIYDKIKTVMFVNKQLNSYNNYYALEQYPEALDSLLKGLSRYDKYIELATMLGIETDLDYVRSQILAELYNVFNLTEQEAIQILEYDSMQDYSLAVYDVVLEKMNN